MKKYKSKYDWSEIDAYFFAGHTLEECKLKFNFEQTNLWYARKVGKSQIPIVSKSIRRPLEDILVYGKYEDTATLKRRLIKEGLLKYKCSVCSITEWCGQHLMLQLDHIDGDRLNNILSNLRLLCPNCHSQTETWCVGKKLRNRASRFSTINRI